MLITLKNYFLWVYVPWKNISITQYSESENPTNNLTAFFVCILFSLYVRGTEVLLRIKELELSTKFLGAETGLTILEADAHIVKLLSSPARKYQTTVQ